MISHFQIEILQKLKLIQYMKEYVEKFFNETKYNREGKEPQFYFESSDASYHRFTARFLLDFLDKCSKKYSEEQPLTHTELMVLKDLRAYIKNRKFNQVNIDYLNDT